MSENQPIWIMWARTLEQWGINKGAATLLEAIGSFNVLLAQLIYIGQPLLSGAVSLPSLEALAHVLENPDDRQAFAAVLREGVHHESAA